MPRKRKNAPTKRRESSGDRWKRQRAAKARDRALGIDPNDPYHLRIDLDSLEFACLFTVVGGQAPIGPGSIRAIDMHGKEPGKAVAPNLLQIGRDKAAELMARAIDAEQIRQIREDQREEKKQSQVQAIMAATERDAFGWRRQDVPDQKLRSVLCGSNAGKDPTRESQSLVICYKENGRYIVAEETWDGSWSEPNDTGHRERIGVELAPLPVSFHDESEAQTAVVFAAKIGELDRFADRLDPAWVGRFAARTAEWDRAGDDMKARYPRRKPEVQNRKPDEIDFLLDDVRADLGLQTKIAPPKPKGRRVRIETQTHG